MKIYLAVFALASVVGLSQSAVNSPDESPVSAVTGIENSPLGHSAMGGATSSRPVADDQMIVAPKAPEIVIVKKAVAGTLKPIARMPVMVAPHAEAQVAAAPVQRPQISPVQVSPVQRPPQIASFTDSVAPPQVGTSTFHQLGGIAMLEGQVGSIELPNGSGATTEFVLAFSPPCETGTVSAIGTDGNSAPARFVNQTVNPDPNDFSKQVVNQVFSVNNGNGAQLSKIQVSFRVTEFHPLGLVARQCVVGVYVTNQIQ